MSVYGFSLKREKGCSQFSDSKQTHLNPSQRWKLKRVACGFGPMFVSPVFGVGCEHHIQIKVVVTW